MSGSLININLPIERVCELLRELDGVAFIDLPDGLGMEFAPGEVARAYDANPDPGTDINVKAYSRETPRRIYDFLEARTTAALWMTDDFSDIIATRGITVEELERARETHDR